MQWWVGDLGEKWGVTDKWSFFKGSENYVDIAKLKYSGQGKFPFFFAAGNSALL